MRLSNAGRSPLAPPWAADLRVVAGMLGLLGRFRARPSAVAGHSTRLLGDRWRHATPERPGCKAPACPPDRTGAAHPAARAWRDYPHHQGRPPRARRTGARVRGTIRPPAWRGRTAERSSCASATTLATRSSSTGRGETRCRTNLEWTDEDEAAANRALERLIAAEQRAERIVATILATWRSPEKPTQAEEVPEDPERDEEVFQRVYEAVVRPREEARTLLFLCLEHGGSWDAVPEAFRDRWRDLTADEVAERIRRHGGVPIPPPPDDAEDEQ
jgi:hypothetical protein